MKKQVKNYVDNSHLREMVIEYNESNYLDDGTWVIPYMQKMNNKFNNGTLEAEELKAKSEFITRFTIKNLALRRSYFYGSPITQLKMKNRFFKARTNLLEPIYNITEGRIRAMKLYATMDYDNIQDIKMDAVLKVLDYLNRYDGERKTSAFAYITQQAFNFVVYFLNQLNAHNKKYVSNLDFFENINTIDDYRGNGKTPLYESL